MSIRIWASALCDLVAPWHCPGCNLPLCEGDRGPGFCGACMPLLEPPVAGFEPPATAAAVHLYAGPLADGIRRLKYYGRLDVADALGALLASAAPAYRGKVDCIVPVPLHRKRLAERGFNQAAVITGPLARGLGVPILYGALVRPRPTVQQAGLSAPDRHANVEGAFTAQRSKIAGRRVLVVDDVRTTGATLAAASAALVEAGAKSVHALALAHAPNDVARP